MRFVTLLLAVCCSSLAAAGPTTQPVRPPERMTAELTGPVSLRGRVPLTLTLFSTGDGPRRDFTNYSFTFVVLDENGRQVGGPRVFIREAVTVKLQLDGKEAAYKPPLVFNRDREGLVPGRKYQLVCVMPKCDLAASDWFTLAD